MDEADQFTECGNLIKFYKPKGLQIYRDFISETEEQDIVNHLYTSLNSSWGRMKSRRIMHFGHNYVYKSFSTNSDAPEFPQFATQIIKKCKHFNIIEDHEEFDQLTIQEYVPGSGIGPHIDTTEYFGDKILILSLMDTWTMDFRLLDKSSNASIEDIPVRVLRRGMLMMTGKSRFEYRHGIRERTTDIVDGKVRKRSKRISLTFRKVIL